MQIFFKLKQLVKFSIFIKFHLFAHDIIFFWIKMISVTFIVRFIMHLLAHYIQLQWCNTLHVFNNTYLHLFMLQRITDYMHFIRLTVQQWRFTSHPARHPRCRYHVHYRHATSFIMWREISQWIIFDKWRSSNYYTILHVVYKDRMRKLLRYYILYKVGRQTLLITQKSTCASPIVVFAAVFAAVGNENFKMYK